MRDIDKISDEEYGLKLSSFEKRSLTLDERDQIIRKYNNEYVEPESNPSDILEIKEWNVAIWNPQIKGTPVDSEEQVLQILKEIMPGIFKHPRFESLKHQISVHMKAVHEFGHRDTVSYREIAAFAKKNKYPSTTLEAWILQGVQPQSYHIINENALTKEKAEGALSEIHKRLEGLDTRASLDTPYHELRTKTLPGFTKDYENACGFYRFLDELGGGGVVSDIARRTGVDRADARRYAKGSFIPRLIRRVQNAFSDKIENIKEKSIIQNEGQYEQILTKNPHICDLEGFNDMDRHMRGYLRVKQMQQSDTLTSISLEELATNLKIAGSRLNHYLNGKSAPKLESILLIHEDTRLRYEGKLSPLACNHRIEPELVYRELRQYKGIEHPDIDALVASFRAVYEQTDISSKVRWIDLQRYAPTGQEWYRGFVKTCKKHLSYIEDGLNEQLDLGESERLRLGVVASRIYLRLENVSENDWMQLNNDEMFHFHDSNRIDGVLSQAKARLGIKGDISLSRLVHQITDYDKSLTERGMNSDLHSNASYIKGSTLSLLLDSCGMTIQNVEKDITSIGRIDRHLIRNPKFSKDSLEIDKAFARLFGAGLSDGHIDQFRVFCYGDANLDRVNIFKNHVGFFGDVDYTERISKRGFHDLRYSSILGRMLERRGFTVGDKTVQNRGIPTFILEGPVEVLVEYLKQLWVEDGEFSSTVESHKAFRWTRSVALIDPEKDYKYGIDRNFAQDITSFMQEHGKYTEDCSFSQRKSYPRYVLSKSDLDSLIQDKDIHISESARWLSLFIKSNKPILMNHKRNLLNRIDIATRDNYDEITYYIETGRVSVLFRATTISLDDAMKVAAIAAPDDKQKRLKVIEWIQSDYLRFKRICNEMKAKRYQISLDETEFQ